MADRPTERLVDYLADLISYAATPQGAADIKAKMGLWDTRGLAALNLNLVPGKHPSAWISTNDPDGAGVQLRHFNEADRDLLLRPQPAVRHITTIGLELILTAGELLADTLARTQAPTLIPDAPPGSGAEGKANPETTKATGTGIRSGLQSERSALARKTQPLNTAKSNAGGGGEQPPLASPARESRTRRRPPINPHRSAPHGSHRNDAASTQARRVPEYPT